MGLTVDVPSKVWNINHQFSSSDCFTCKDMQNYPSHVKMKIPEIYSKDMSMLKLSSSNHNFIKPIGQFPIKKNVERYKQLSVGLKKFKVGI